MSRPALTIEIHWDSHDDNNKVRAFLFGDDQGNDGVLAELIDGLDLLGVVDPNMATTSHGWKSHEPLSMRSTNAIVKGKSDAD